MHALAASLIEQLRLSLSDACWLSPPTRTRALRKLDALTIEVGALPSSSGDATVKVGAVPSISGAMADATIEVGALPSSGRSRDATVKVLPPDAAVNDSNSDSTADADASLKSSPVGDANVPLGMLPHGYHHLSNVLRARAWHHLHAMNSACLAPSLRITSRLVASDLISSHLNSSSLLSSYLLCIPSHPMRHVAGTRVRTDMRAWTMRPHHVNAYYDVHRHAVRSLDLT